MRVASAPVSVIAAFRCVLALSLAVLLADPALASPPSFDRALANWLHHDESEGLTELAMLAQASDGRARLLLGLIDKSPSLQGPWLTRLPRSDRMALMRAPGGLSGQSWLTLAPDQPMAQSWLGVLRVDAGLETVMTLIALGEDRAARQAVAMLAMRDRLNLGDAWPEWLDPELAWLAWPTAGRSLRADILTRVPDAHPQRAMMGQPLADRAHETWLTQSPAAAPLRAICDSYCPESRLDCLMAAYAALNDHSAILTMGSPAESLISQEAFLSSLRGRRAVLRRILMSTNQRGRNSLLDRAGRSDACLGEVLATENNRYRFVRAGSEQSERLTAGD